MTATTPDLFDAAVDGDDLHWPRVRDWLSAHPDSLAADRALLEELGLKAHGRNVVDFGAAALSRLEGAVEREADARRRIEAVAQANFAAQTQTHAAALDLMEARNAADLARRLETAARTRFGLAGAVLVLEKPGPVPFGWKALEPERTDALVGPDGLHWLGPAFDGLNLFGAGAEEVRSVALIRMAPHFPGEETPRAALCAFGSGEDDGFTPVMGCELAAFIARVAERMAERWPVLN